MFYINNLYFIIAVLILLGAKPPAKPLTVEDSGAAWTPILSKLNQELAAKEPLSLPFSHGLDEDLLDLNDRELSSIKQTWMGRPESKQKGDKKVFRDQQNQFFHQEVTALNHKTFEKLKAAANSHERAKKDYRLIGEKVLLKVQQNPVAKLESVQTFDRGDEIGFCFGRALLIHYLLLQAGVPQDDLAKVFTVGQLMVEKQLWRFHVAVLVRDSTAGFLLIDPLHPKPIEYKKWLEINARYDVKGPFSRARFYVTDPRKFLPGFGAYKREQFEDPVLKPYFGQLPASLIK